MALQFGTACDLPKTGVGHAESAVAAAAGQAHGTLSEIRDLTSRPDIHSGPKPPTS